jgi:hypothetical protein
MDVMAARTDVADLEGIPIVLRCPVYSSIISNEYVLPPREVAGSLLMSTQRKAPGVAAGLVVEGGIDFCFNLAARQCTQGP